MQRVWGSGGRLKPVSLSFEMKGFHFSLPGLLWASKQLARELVVKEM